MVAHGTCFGDDSGVGIRFLSEYSLCFRNNSMLASEKAVPVTKSSSYGFSLSRTIRQLAKAQ